MPADEKADAALLEGIADWCDRFTPLVSLDPPDGLFLDITGAAHLFGGEAAMLTTVTRQIAGQGFAVQAAIAGTSLAARALATLRQPAIIARIRRRSAELSRPCPSRRWNATTGRCARLRRAGLKTIGQVAAALAQRIVGTVGQPVSSPG